MAKKLEVFDPPMRCSAGVCGVEVDLAQTQFAADLKWVAAHGIDVQRHNLGYEPESFAANPAVVKEMRAGMDRLPILTVDGRDDPCRPARIPRVSSSRRSLAFP